ncbi:holocytochrome-c synthase [Aureococcus anophagefferens]|nr:holocytochrome-c synthase [Aureococcus anophagefferens]
MSVARLAASCAAAACASTTAARLAEIPSGCPMHADRQKGARAGPGGALSTERVESSIPTLDAGSRWTYPSPQMFWNSLVRKGKVGGASEGDMDTVIAVHNSMNEATWAKILEWEALSDPGAPRRGSRGSRGGRRSTAPRPGSSSSLGTRSPSTATTGSSSGDGAEVRYVIDYYSDEAATARDETPKTMHDVGAVKSILLDVRPALDSPAALWDRVATMPLKRLRGEAAAAEDPDKMEAAYEAMDRALDAFQRRAAAAAGGVRRNTPSER